MAFLLVLYSIYSETVSPGSAVECAPCWRPTLCCVLRQLLCLWVPGATPEEADAVGAPAGRPHSPPQVHVPGLPPLLHVRHRQLGQLHGEAGGGAGQVSG